MNEYVFFFLLIVGIIAWCLYDYKSKESQKAKEKEKTIAKKQNLGETKGDISVEIPQSKCDAQESALGEESIEILSDGTWICPNDETINDGDICIICGQNRPGFVPKPVNPVGRKNVSTIVSRTIVTEQAFPQKGFTVAYKANPSPGRIVKDTSKPITACLKNISGESDHSNDSIIETTSVPVAPEIERSIPESTSVSDALPITQPLNENSGTESPAQMPVIRKIQYCRRCGFKLIDGSEFCSNCGTKIEKESEV